MRDEEKFVLDYGSGHFELNVGQYFSQANKRSLKKFLQLSRRYCTEHQREALIQSIQIELDYRRSVLLQLNDMWGARDSLLRRVFGNSAGFSPEKKAPEKRLERQIAKLEARMYAIQKERWNA